MARQAELADGTILEFPDNTPDDVMDRAVRNHIATPSILKEVMSTPLPGREPPSDLARRIDESKRGRGPTPNPGGVLDAMADAPRSTGTGPATRENIVPRLRRRHWERGREALGRDIEAGKEQTDRAISRELGRLGGEQGVAQQIAEFGTVLGVDPGTTIYDDEVKAGADEYAQRRADDDPLSTVATKFFQNLPQRAKHYVAGLVEAGASIRSPDELIFGRTDAQKRLDTAGAAEGRRMSLEAKEALRRNAPNVEDDSPVMFGYDVANAFVDFGSAVAASAATGSPTAGLTLMGAQVFGDKFAESRDAGRSASAAFIDATWHTAAEIIPESRVLKTLWKPGQTFFGRVARTAGEEAAQEAITQVLQDGYDKGVIGEDMTWGQILRNSVRSGAIGGIVGGGTAAATGGASKLKERSRPATVLDGIAEEASADPTLGLAPVVELTPEDRASPIPDSVIAAGKGVLAGVDSARAAEEAPHPETARARVEAFFADPANAEAPTPEEALAALDAARERPIVPESAAARDATALPADPQPPRAAAGAAPPAKNVLDRMVQITLHSESRNRDFGPDGKVLTSPAGARGKMQVMPGTETDPGFGVRPAQNNSVAELARVGRDYLAAMLRRYGGDPAKAWAAYNWGPGNLDGALKAHGANWLDHAPAETRKYVFGNISRMGGGAFNQETGELAPVPEEEIAAAIVPQETPEAYVRRILGEDALSPSMDAPPADMDAPAATEENNEGDRPDNSGQASTYTMPNGTERDVRARPELGPTFDHPRTETGEHAVLSSVERHNTKDPLTGPVNWLLANRYAEPDKKGALTLTDAGRARLAALEEANGAAQAGRDREAAASAAVTPGESPERGAPPPVAPKRRPGQRADGKIDFLTWIANNGGLRDNEDPDKGGVHGLRKMRNLQRMIPGVGPLIHKKGLSPDQIGELAYEAGWFTSRPTESEVLELIERSSFSPVYHPEHAADMEAEEAERRGPSEEEVRAEIVDVLDAYAVLASEEDKDRILSRMAQGADAETAVFDHFEEAARDTLSENETLAGEYDIPFAEGGESDVNFAGPEEEGAGVERRPEEAGRRLAGERPAPESGSEAGRDDEQAGEGSAPAAAEGSREGVAIEDLPSGKSLIIRGATPEQLAAVRAALPEKVQPLENARLGGVVYSKKHEAKIRAALETREERSERAAVGPARTVSVEEMAAEAAGPKIGAEGDSRLTNPERAALERLLVSEKKGGEGWHKESDAAARVGRILDAGATSTDADEKLLLTALRLAEKAAAPKTFAAQFRALPADPEAWHDLRVRLIKQHPEHAAEVLDAMEEAGGVPKSADERKAAERFKETQRGWGETATKIVDALRRGGSFNLPGNERSLFISKPEQVEAVPTGLMILSGNQRLTVPGVDLAGVLAEAERNAALGPQEGEERRALEAKADGRKRAAKPQKAPGSDGGLFDTPDTTSDLFSAPAAPKGYGASNRLVTADRAAELRERLKAKLSSAQLNAGLDPELIALGTELAVFHVEAGARRFADFAKAIANDLGTSVEDLRRYLRGWYNGARDMLEDAGEDIEGMDGPGAVKAALSMIEDAPTRIESAAPTQAESLPRNQVDSTATLSERLTASFRSAFASRGFASITEARAFAAEQTGESFGPGTANAKLLEEAIEVAVVQAARDIAAANDPAQAYRLLVDLYGRQPKLSVRTSTSVENQAYSTPVPLAYVASRLAGVRGITDDSALYEPSAGNGALLIEARAENIVANEIDPDRAAALKTIYPGAEVTTRDASTFVPKGAFDVVIANPPFGTVRGEDGESRTFNVDGRYRTNEIDHAIAMKALEAMTGAGRAVLIVGSVNKQLTDPKKRSDAYNGKAKREFYYKLYGAYNVVDHFTVSGDLYERQGAGWPVDVIVIEGRGKSALSLPAVKVPRQYDTWDALSEVLDGREDAAQPDRQPDRNDSGEGGGSPAADEGDRGDGGSGRDSGRGGEREDGQPSDLHDGPADGESAGVRMGADREGDAAAPSDQQPERPAGRAQPPVETAENERQVAYKPGSGGPAMGTLVPVNMQTAVDDALKDLRERVGDIDDFVSDRLGYEQTDLFARFGGEQVDAIALAIDNIERGAGFIIGDQTGIGKGRVVAAVIRYAMRQNRTPIFVTEKPNLYKDMYRDMTDIGIPEMLGRDMRIVMTDAAKVVPLDDDGTITLKTPAASVHNADLENLGREGAKRSGVDVLFTTYSQMQSIGGEPTARQRALRALAPGGVVILDESHNAGGQGPSMIKPKKDAEGKIAAPNRAEFVREIVGLAHGVFYSSATYAKRPDVMDLYAATNMRLAVDDISKLGDAIAKGGVPMQQIVAASLARDGQYLRRERSFEGIAYNTPHVPVDQAQYEAASRSLKAIQTFSEDHVAEAAERVNDELKNSAENVAFDGATGGAGAASTNFTAIMHNVIDQMLLAFVAKDTADRAIGAISRGEKPVITVANTLEAFLTQLAEEDGVRIGQAIDISFADVFRRYLERSRWLTIRKPFMEKGEKGERVRLSDEQLGPAGVRAFKNAMAMIDGAGLETLPGSPIDYILSRIEDAGHKVAEITGRTLGLNYRDGKAYLKARGAADKSISGRIGAITRFNEGSVAAMLINQSGATGLSLHASAKFKDQRKRRMIIAQAERNIDTHMQMLGRVHRTGQVVLPEYDQLVADIPASKRPASVLAKKMASLNASTTASRDSAVTAKDVPDFMNVYGDEVAARIMEEEPELHDLLGHPLKEEEEGYVRDGAMRRVTGRIPLLTLRQQEDIYQRLETEYAELLANKEAAGENALEAKTLELDARTEDTTEAVAAKTGVTSRFGAPVMVETVNVKRLGKPYTGESVRQMVAEGQASAPDLTKARGAGEAFVVTQVSGASSSAADSLRKRLTDVADRWNALTRIVKPGATVKLKTDNGNLYGAVTSLVQTGNPKNPLALGSWKATVALVDSSRQVTLPLSQLAADTGGASVPGKIMVETAAKIGDIPIMDAFDRMQTDSRETRHMITGNILAGFDFMNGRGAIINFTDSEGGVRQGILAPRGWDFEKHKASKSVPLTDHRAIVDFLSTSLGGITGRGKNGDIVVQLLPQRGELIVTTSKAKRAGGEFFLNRELTAALGTDFVSSSAGMVARTRADAAGPALQVLLKSGVRFEIPGSADAAVKERARDAMQRHAAVREPARQFSLWDYANDRETDRNVRGSPEAVPARRGGSVRALGVADDLRREGATALVGRTAENPDELAAIAQVHRDPRFETLRVFFMKGSEIVHATGVSARLPGTAPLLPGELSSVEEWAAWLRETMAAAGADGYFLLHNHPSGEPNPSRPDIEITQEAARLAPGFRGHVIINSNRYAVIEADGKNVVREKDFGEDRLLKASKPHSVLGMVIPDGPALTSVGKMLQRPGYVTLIATDARLRVRAVVDYPESDLSRPPLILMGALRRTMRQSGSTNLFLVGSREAISTPAVRQAIGKNIITEAVDENQQPSGWERGFGRSPLERERGAFVADDAARFEDGEAKPDPESMTGLSRLLGDGTGMAERIDAWRTRLQDRMLPLLRTQQRVEMQTGQPIPESFDAYRAEELMSGKVGARLERLTDELVTPLFDRMKAEKVSVEELETYLYARHAPERNARIAEINPEFEEGTGSGMSDAEAAAIMERVKAEGKEEALQRLAKRVDGILKFAVDTRVEAGLLSEEEAQAWQEMYRHYVPLRGMAEIEPENGSSERPRRGSGINVRGPESRRAFGRKSRADNILAYSLMQAEEAIVRAGTNEVGQAFYALAKASPDPEFWTINKISRKPTWNKKSGQVTYRSENQITAEDAPYTVSLKINGQERRVTMNRANPAAVRLAEAMRNLNGTQMAGIMRVLSSVNRFLSFVNTGLNPEFVITNAFRDLQTASVNLKQFDQKGIVRGTLKDYPAALKGSIRGAFKKDGGTWGKWYREFVDEGGRVYFNRVEDLNELERRIKREFSNQRPGISSARKAASALFTFIEQANIGVENAVRLSAYKNARERGMSKTDAASLAKNLTVNFNRRGAWGVAMNSLYLFYNASVQGSVRMLQAARSKSVRRVLYGAIATGAVLELLNTMLSDDDDDGESYYDKISDFDKSRNLILMLPGKGGRHIKIPLPYGYNSFFAMGRAGAEIARGRRWQESGSALAMTIVDSFNPIGGTNSLLNLIAPTIADPIVDLELNRDYADRPIMPEQNPFGVPVPDNQRYWNSVSPHWRTITDFLNKASGGDDVVPGAVDVSPETLEHLSGVVTGAAGTFFIDRMGGLIEKAVTGEAVTANDLPLARKLVGEKPSWYDKAAYYARVAEIEQAEEYLKGYREKDETERADAFEEANANLLGLASAVKRAKKSMKRVRSQRNEAEAMREGGELSASDYRSLRTEINEQERLVLTDFNAEYLSVVERPKHP